MKIIILKNREFRFFLIVSILSLLMFGCSGDEINPNTDTPPIGEEPPVNSADELTQISINTFGNAIVDDPKIIAEITISKANTINYQGNIGIETRGASSQSFPKKSYGLETRDSNDEDLDVSLLELPEEEDWILYAPYSDKSLMRNVLIYDLSRELNMYASRTKFVELTLNNSPKGLYVFMEKLKRDL